MATYLRRVTAFASLVLLWAGPALAQHSGAVRVAVGSAKPYIDEPWQLAGAGSLRLQLRSRLDVEPEFAISDGSRFRIWTIIPNVAYTFGKPQSPVEFYVIGGIGYFHELDKSIDYARAEMAWNGGMGVRVRLTQRVFIAPDLRIGHVSRVTVGLGYRF